MKNRLEWENLIAQKMDLPGEPMPGLPIAELAGDSRVLIEHHMGIVEYEPGQIGVRMAYGRLCIRGSRLEMVCMTREQLVISGCIDSISILRRC